MSTSRHLAHLSWSPLHPPLVQFRTGQPQDAAPRDLRDGENVEELRESDGIVPAQQAG